MATRLTLPRVQRVTWRLLEANGGRRPTIGEMAAGVGLTERQFERALRSAGTTPRKVRAWCCVTFAEYLIGKGTKCDAAMALAGYRNHTNFNRRYRDCLGCCRPNPVAGKRGC